MTTGIDANIQVSFKYAVSFERDIFSPTAHALSDALNLNDLPEGKRVRAIVFVDSGVEAVTPDLVENINAWAERNSKQIELAANVQVVPGGEEIKNSLSILDTVGELVAGFGLDRHSYIIIIGGGAVLDGVGWAASTIHRGLRQIRIPTTTLSQDDSAVGVKNGVNRFGQKNYYGAFAPPSAVIVDTEFLKTLPRRELIAGLSEAFKVGIIRDRKFLDELVECAAELGALNFEVIERVVRRSAEIHLEHIMSEGDAFEAGSSRPLDFGHWAAHRLEDLTNYELRHGEAVAIGIALDLQIARILNLATESDVERVTDALVKTGLEIWHDALLEKDEAGELKVFRGLAHFREHLGGELTLAMPDGLGCKRDIHALDYETVERGIVALKRKVASCASARQS